MKKLNTLFCENHAKALDELAGDSLCNKSELARAAMSIGIGMLVAAMDSMTDREFCNYVAGSEDISDKFLPISRDHGDE